MMVEITPATDGLLDKDIHDIFSSRDLRVTSPCSFFALTTAELHSFPVNYLFK